MKDNQGRPYRQTNDSTTFVMISLIGIVILVIFISLIC